MSQYETQNSTDTLEFSDTAIWAFYQDENTGEVLHTRSPRTMDEEGDPDPPPPPPPPQTLAPPVWTSGQDENTEVLQTRSPRTMDEEGDPDPPPPPPPPQTFAPPTFQ